jgi:hypothetical protein
MYSRMTPAPKAILLGLTVFATCARSGYAQEPTPSDSTASPVFDTLAPETFGLKDLSDYLGLTPADISFRSDYTEPDSFRLKKVAELMRRPIDMIDYARQLKNAHATTQPEIISEILFEDLVSEYQTGRSSAYKASGEELTSRYNLVFDNLTLNQLLNRAAMYIDVVIPKSTEMSLALLKQSQRAFLLEEFRHLVTMDTADEFRSPDELDSLEKIEEKNAEKFAGFGTRIDKDPVLQAGIDCLRDLGLDIKALRKAVADGSLNPDKIIAGSSATTRNAQTELLLGKQPGWRIGGTGNDVYSGDYKFILDFGGDDVYDLSYDPAHPHPVIIIDLGGNDTYRAQSDFAIASGCQSVGLLMDYGGNDLYLGKSFSLGSGYFGFGLLYDAAGDDIYSGDTHVEGAGTFGIGLLIDEGGRDSYSAAVYAQGFGFVQGAGLLYDCSGNDTYSAGGKYTDIIRYEDHYLSMSQGFASGLRPTLSGGIGALIDLKGNDSYTADIFAQACAYWWGLGIIYDSSGNDSYHAYQYGQGAATHMALGCLVDDYGNDVYFGKGLMQGCGHDYSCGLILDRHGNDTYTAYDLSQGAGSANGAGVLIDNNGDDRYFVKNPGNTQGYGNPRRDFGSIGLFIDLGGRDQYDGNGRDNYYWRTKSKWGGGMDIQLIPVDTTKAVK